MTQRGMTGYEHYRAAEKLLSEGSQEVQEDPDQQSLVLLSAQVHATLALAEAVNRLGPS